MTNSYTDIFGGITIYPSDIGFIDYSITQSSTFVWSTNGEASNSGTSLAVAKFTRISVSGAGIVTILPDADAASVGNTLRFKNNGATTFTIKSASGSTIATMSAGQDILLSITNNTTSGGLWDSSYIGSGTTSANASVLAGAGLSTSGATLITNWPVDFTGSAGYQITTTGTGRVLTWTGGAGSIEIALDTGTLRNGFITAIKNQGTGILTVSGNATNGIDGAVGSAISLYPNDSTFIVGAGNPSGLYSIGLTNNNTTGILEIDASAGTALSTGTVTLTAAQSTNKIFIITNTIGNAANNLTIVFPQVSGEFIISNQSQINNTQQNSGGFVTIQTSGGGASVRIPIGGTRTVYSDGTNIVFADDLSQSRPALNIVYWGDFGKNPWQRGTSFTSSSVATYTADRVSAICASGAGFQITRVASTDTGCQYDLRIQRTSGAPTASGTTLYLGFDLPIEDSIALRGKNVTLAARVSTGSTNATLPSFGIYTSGGSNNKVVNTLASGWNLAALISAPVITSAAGYYQFSINPPGYSTGSPLTLTTALSQVSVLCQISLTATGANDYINISRLALVEGTFSSFDNLEVTDVRNKCQSFCYVPTASAVGQVFGIGQAVSANQAVVPIQFPATMYKAPSLDTVTAAGFQITNSVNGALTVTSVTMSGPNSYGAELIVPSTTASLIAGQVARFQAATATSKLVFTADL